MRIIPARAGPTRHADHMVSTLADHPRSCGANSARAIYMLVVSGSSPLVRGQQGSTRVIERQHRIIPARAGPTALSVAARKFSADHPRSCGANHRDTGCAEYGDGSSPLVRGQHPIQPRRIANQRIIPARAGPTDAGVPYVATGSDHPRSCGANLTAVTGTSIISGSSPLGRGQHQHDLLPTPFLRIIPARAGPTWRRTQGPRAAADHPRSCGANHRLPLPLGELDGSSPLVRGQPALVIVMMHPPWIIPARAGPTRTHVRRERLA